MAFERRILSGDYHAEAADTIARALPRAGSVVLTGGGTAEAIYRRLATRDVDWSSIDIAFSDERCVPPEDDASNYGMAKRTLLDFIDAGTVFRMEGEAPPLQAADTYHSRIAGLVASRFDLMLLGIGDDCHICGLFPGSPALGVDSSLCVPVQRPDGMTGITLTPPAVRAAKKVMIFVSGAAKAQAVARAIESTESPTDCPARLLASHPDATFFLDENAALRPA